MECAAEVLVARGVDAETAREAVRHVVKRASMDAPRCVVREMLRCGVDAELRGGVRPSSGRLPLRWLPAHAAALDNTGFLSAPPLQNAALVVDRPSKTDRTNH